MASKSDLKTATKSYDIEAYARTRNEAISKCFSKLKEKAYADADNALINMQVVDVFINDEKEETTVQKLFGYFMPRERKDYFISLKIICEIKYL